MDADRHARVWSPRQLRWLLNAYPPLLFQRIRVVEISPDFRRAVIRVRRSILSRNLQGSTFGGTIYAAVDPFHALLLWQICAHEGIRVQAWMKQATVEFRRPADTDLEIVVELSEADVADVLAHVREDGRFARRFRAEATDRAGAVCAVVHTEIRILRPGGDRTPS